MPWTSTCTSNEARAELWEQSIAAMITKAYIRDNGAAWNEPAYHKAVLSIYDNILLSDTQTVKLAKTPDSSAVAMIYDCSQCERRGQCAKETPITLDDIRRIIQHLGIGWKAFFNGKVDPHPSVNTKGLKLLRDEHCIFFDQEKHCTIQEIRPMHCKFTPCPRKTETAQQMSCLYLGSGTVEDQFRHQVALTITRQYVAECGVKYNKHAVRRMLETIDHITGDHEALKRFCENIAPYRYVDDTLTILKHADKAY